MDRRSTSVRAFGVGRYTRLLSLASLMALVVLGFTASPSLAMKKEKTNWLCRPGKVNEEIKYTGKDVKEGGPFNEGVAPEDPCEYARETTVLEQGGGTSVVDKPASKKEKKKPVDCFYVYPTVSEQAGPNATTNIEEAERVIAIDQASRFSQVCNVYAPMYKQLTLSAIKGAPSKTAPIIAYESVAAAFKEYITKFNKPNKEGKRRPFVFIGHSQGSFLLKALIPMEVETHPEYLGDMVSALLMGGQVFVPEGQRVGGTFKKVPTCEQVDETGCVIAYSTFLKEPPEDSLFGRKTSALEEGSHAGEEVACVNPTISRQDGAEGLLEPYASTVPFPGELGEATPLPEVSTAWATTPDLYSAQCHKENGASWLQVNTVGTNPEKAPPVEERIGPEWGLHLYDINIALGNLVHTVAIQTAQYEYEH